MKKWNILLGLLMVVFVACSDDKSTTDDDGDGDPLSPVTDVQIPAQGIVGSIVVIQGKGFDSDSTMILRLQPNGGEAFEAEVLAKDAVSVTIGTTGLAPGFYVILLEHAGKNYRLGGINLVVIKLEAKDVEGYGIVGEASSQICPVSISKKLKGEPLFSLTNDHEFNGGMMTADSVWYYTSFAAYYDDQGFWKGNRYEVKAYDFRKKTNKTLEGNIENLLAIGWIEGSLHMVRLSADKATCHILKWGGEAFAERAFFAYTGSKMIAINDGIFLYDEAHRSLVMAGRDLSGVTRKFVWAIGLDNPQIRETGGSTEVNFHLLPVGETVYAFGEKRSDSGGVDTYVLRLENPSDWQFSALTPEIILRNSGFMSPAYARQQNVIFGIDDDGTVLTYDLQTKQLAGGKWVNSGLDGLIIF